jgi:ribosomal protein S18 acetylase RimI-like enzyme
VEVRRALPGESDTIAAILLAAFSELKDGYTPEAFAVVTPPAEEIAERFNEGPQWLAVIEGIPLGTVSVVGEPDHLYIRSMAVLPAAQGLGVGRRMLEAVESYALENGFERLFLYTTHFSAGAKKLYENFGFEWVADTTAEEWYGVPGLAMEKKLEAGTKRNATGS